MNDPVNDPIREVRGLPTPPPRAGFWEELHAKVTELEASDGTDSLAMSVSDTVPPAHRRRLQRLVLLAGVAATLIIVAVAAVGLNRRHPPSSTLSTPTTPITASTPTTPVPGSVVPSNPTTTLGDVWTGPYRGDTSAKNFLITGQSSAPCVDPDDATVGGFGDGNTASNLADSIMVLRISPATNQAAVLSFPRDLWVRIHGRNGSGRINTAFDPTDPTRLAGTITDNFGIPIDHYVNLNMCTFKTLVDAVGGVNVPFQFKVWDDNVGLDVPAPGCVSLDGDQALAWVRSRKLRYIDHDGNEQQDGSSDFGRISRQQDLLRRLATKAISDGLVNPSTAAAFIDTYLGPNITTDTGLTVGKMLDFVSAMRDIDPTTIRAYQLETVAEPHNGMATLVVDAGSSLNLQVIALFQGAAQLPEASTSAATTTPAETIDTASAATSLPTVDPPTATVGIVPPDDPTCTP